MKTSQSLILLLTLLCAAALAFSPSNEDQARRHKAFCAPPMLGDTEAISNYTDTIRLNPKDANAYYKRGVMYFDIRNYDKTKADWESVLRIDPNYPEAEYILQLINIIIKNCSEINEFHPSQSK